MIGRQVAAARALLGWTQMDLSEVSDLDAVTISNFESGHTGQPHRRSIRMIREAFMRRGVVFINDKGVMLK